MRRLLAVLAVLGVLALTLIPASTAEAVTIPPPAVMVDDIPDAEKLGGMSLRSRMLTVLGSIIASDRGGVLGDGGASGRAWAYSAYNTGFSEKKLRQMMEFSTLNPGGPVPQRSQEYVLQAHEFDAPVKTDPKTGVRSFRVSPTPPKQFFKTVGGLFSGAFFVPMIGGMGSDALGAWMGYEDVTGDWCTAFPSDFAGQLFHNTFSVLSGRDCTGFLDFPESFEVNADMEAVYLSASHNGHKILGYLGPDSQNLRACFAVSWNVKAAYIDGNTVSYAWDQNRYPVAGWQALNFGPPYDTCAGYVLPVGYQAGAVSFSYGNPPRVGVGPPPNAQNVASPSELTLSDELPDPERYLECVITLDDGSTLVGSGSAYQESSGAMSPPVCPTVPPGKVATNVAVNEHLVGSPGTSTSLYNEPASEEYQEWATSYPECADGACLLDLRVKSGSVLGASCFDMGDQCSEWFADPAKADKYQCTYGAHDVSIDECAVYSGMFNPGRVAVGAPYSDPMTGDWNGTASAPRLDGQAMAQSVQNPAATRACNGLNVTGFDPVGFVLRPIQCALEWAFVPRPLVVEAELAGGEASWEGKPPAVIAGAVSSFALTPAVSGCSKSVTIFSGVFEQTITPIDVCPGSMARPFADASRVVTAAVMVVLVVIVVRRQIAGMVGYGQGQ